MNVRFEDIENKETYRYRQAIWECENFNIQIFKTY
nr:MAG TPA: hypothetical protein [Bacteriophage sp.]